MIRLIFPIFMCVISLFSYAQNSAEILAVDVLLEPTGAGIVDDDPLASFMASGVMECSADITVNTTADIDSLRLDVGTSLGGTELGAFSFAKADLTLADIHTDEFFGIAMRSSIGLIPFSIPFHLRAVLVFSDGTLSAPFEYVIQ